MTVYTGTPILCRCAKCGYESNGKIRGTKTLKDLLRIAISDYPATYNNGGEEPEGTYILEGNLLNYSSTDPELPGDSCEVTVTFVPDKANAFAEVSETAQIHIITEMVVVDG